MEEQQIQDFVHRVSNDDAMRTELTSNPESVLERENFSPRVAEIVRRLVPHLTLHTSFAAPNFWWA